MIAQMVVGQIKAQSAAGATFAVGPDPTVVAGSYTFDLKTSQSYYAIYDENGQPITRISQAQFNTPTGLSTTQKAQCAYQVRLKVDSDKPAVGFSQLTIEVGYPAMAPVAGRKTSSFVAVTRNADS
jgi:hypothetical protein